MFYFEFSLPTLLRIEFFLRHYSFNDILFCFSPSSRSSSTDSCLIFFLCSYFGFISKKLNFFDYLLIVYSTFLINFNILLLLLWWSFFLFYDFTCFYFWSHFAGSKNIFVNSILRLSNSNDGPFGFDATAAWLKCVLLDCTTL